MTTKYFFLTKRNTIRTRPLDTDGPTSRK